MKKISCFFLVLLMMLCASFAIADGTQVVSPGDKVTVTLKFSSTEVFGTTLDINYDEVLVYDAEAGLTCEVVPDDAYVVTSPTNITLMSTNGECISTAKVTIPFTVAADAADGTYTVSLSVAKAYNSDYEPTEAYSVTSAQIVVCSHANVKAIAERVDPTCTKTGMTAGEKCANAACNKIITEREVIPALGHTWVITESAVSPTNTEVGWTAAAECSVCKATVAKAQVAASGIRKEVEPGEEATVSMSFMSTTESASVVQLKLNYSSDLTFVKSNKLIVSPTTNTLFSATSSNVHIVTGDTVTPITATFTYTFTSDVEGLYQVKLISDVVSNSSGSPVIGFAMQGATIVVCDHSEMVDIDTATDPTCTEPGMSAGKKCANEWCGKVLQEQQEIPATGHTPAEAVQENVIEATCTEAGSYDSVVYCSVEDCKAELSRKTITVGATGHTDGETVVENNVDATCTTDGSYDNVVYCTVCGEETSRETITVGATGHTDGEAVVENNVAPDCENAGSYDTVVYCTVCDAELSRVTTTVGALGHKYNEGVVTTEPTCTEEGVKTFTCANDSTHTYTETVEALGHKSSKVEVVSATCTEDGYLLVTCNQCETIFNSSEEGYAKEYLEEWSWLYKLDSIGHSYDEGVVTTEPTCTEEGVKTFTCANDSTHTYTEAVEALGHTDGETVVENNVDATCTTDGSYDNVVYCTVCGEETSRETITVGATGHTDGEAVVENNVAPDCENAGSYDTVVYCTVCDAELSRVTTTVEALGHDEVSHEAQAPTCTEIGWDAYVTCSRCDYTTYVEKPITECSWGEWQPCNENSHQRTCAYNSEHVESDGHNKTITVAAAAATVDAPGKSEAWKCTVCNMQVDSKPVNYLFSVYIQDAEMIVGHKLPEFSYSEFEEESGVMLTGVTLTYKLLDEDGEVIETTGEDLTVGTYTITAEATVAKDHHVVDEIYTGTLTVKRFEVAFSRMQLTNSLAMDFAFAAKNQTDWTGAYVEIVRNGTSKQTVKFENWKSTTINNDEPYYYVRYNNLAAKQMADDIVVTIYNAEGEQISEQWQDSVRAYVRRALDDLAGLTDDKSRKEATMVVDMLNYGTEAQKYFAYNTGNLANSILTADEAAFATPSTSYENSQVKGDNYLGSRLILESNIKLQLAFKNVTQDMKAVVTFTNHSGKAKSFEIAGSGFTLNNGAYVVEISALVVADARQAVTCQIYDGETVVAECIESIESYVARDPDALLIALMKFSDSAYAYLH